MSATDLLELSAAQAVAAIARGRAVDAAELFAVYRERAPPHGGDREAAA